MGLSAVLMAVALVTLEFSTAIAAHRDCHHHHPKADEMVTGVELEPSHVIKKRSLDQPLRIVLYYDESVFRLEPEKFDLINNTILPEAVQFWERTLMVRKTGEVIRLNRKCSSRQVFVKNGRTHCIDSCKPLTYCGEVAVPEAHLNPCYVCNATGQACGHNGTAGEGVAHADFVLYVSAVNTSRCHRGLTVAYAAHCQLEAALDRPIAGHANFCPSELSTRPQELGSMLSTVQHEILHALGFSLSLYAFYRDDDGNPLTDRNPDTGSPPLNEELQIHQWSDRVVRNVTRERWMVRGGYMTRNIQMMVTPRVTSEVRKHFGCSSLEGAELEDQGGEGTALTHWEKRIMENEAMTGTHTQNPVFSRITLALMEDTGWYRADYSQAKELTWGKGLGCAFATRSCKEWINNANVKGRSAHPFCSRVKKDPLQTECSQSRDSVSVCNLVLHDNPLPPLYQHFDWVADAEPGTESHYGGSVSLADYCPYTQEFTWRFRKVAIRGSRCSFPENNPKVDKNFALESYGSNSKCFDHTNRMWEQRSCRQVRQWQHWGSGCYEYRCEGGRLHIIVGNYSYECYHAGQEISVRIVRAGWLHRGALLCPSCRDLCHHQFEKRGEWCKPNDEAPPNTAYPRDQLHCGPGGLGGGSTGGPQPSLRLHVLAVSVSLGVLLSVTGACLCSGTAAHTFAAFTQARERARKRKAVKDSNQKSKFKLEEVVVANNEDDNATSSDPVPPEPPPPQNIKRQKSIPSQETAFCISGNEVPLQIQTFEEAVRCALDKSLGLGEQQIQDQEIADDDDEIRKYHESPPRKQSGVDSESSYFALDKPVQDDERRQSCTERR